MIKYYYPYSSDKPEKKFMVFTPEGKRIYFGASGYEHFTEGHLDEKRKVEYIKRHQRREDWDYPDSSAYWALRFLWLYPTYKKAYANIKKDLLNKKYL